MQPSRDASTGAVHFITDLRKFVSEVGFSNVNTFMLHQVRQARAVRVTVATATLVYESSCLPNTVSTSSQALHTALPVLAI